MEQVGDEEQVGGEEQGLQATMREGWVKIFHEFANEYGELRRKEIIKLMRVCGCNPTDKDVDEYIKEADKNDDQCIDCEEFCLFMEKENAKGNPGKRLKEAFEFYDKDKNGYIERHELKDILKDVGADPEDEDLINVVIESADINGDGKIDIYEFVSRLQCE